MSDASAQLVAEGTALCLTHGLLNTPPELLARIEEYLDKESLISYTTCCKHLRKTGVRTLLFEYPAVLITTVDVQSFCSFMHVDLSYRKRFLRSFTMDTPYPSSDDVLALRGRLAQALINAPILSHVEFGRCLKDILERSPSLFSAIQSLPSLTTLKMETESGPWPHIILRLHHSRITDLDMGYLTIDTPDAFSRHASTLSSLSIGARSVEAALGRMTYANVRSFSWIGAMDQGAWDISAMIELFPNLDRLSVWMRVRPSTSALSELLGSLNSITFPYDVVRSANREKQSGSAWSQLRYLCGDPNALYILAPDCRPSIVSIIDNLEMWGGTEHIHDIVRDIQYPLEILHLKYCPSWQPTLAENLGSLPPDALPEKSIHLINFLVVELLLPSDVTRENLFDIAAAWPVLIGRLSPRIVLFHVRVERCTEAGGTFPTAAETYVQEGGILALGTVIAAAAAAVTMIHVRTSWHDGRRTRGWVNDSNPDPSLGPGPRLFDFTEDMETQVEDMLSSMA